MNEISRKKFFATAGLLGTAALIAADKAHASGGSPTTFTGDVYFESGRPWVDVRAFGAGTATQSSGNDTTAIEAAIAALPATGGIVFFPEGDYYVTTTITVKDKLVVLQGAGGQGNLGGATTINSPTRIRCGNAFPSNAPIVLFTCTNKQSSGATGQCSGMRDIGILGTTTLSGQSGLFIDNRGIYVENVNVGGCGGYGIVVADSVGSTFSNVVSIGNHSDGWIMDYSLASQQSTLPAVTYTEFINCVSYANGGNGWTLNTQTQGIQMLGGTTSDNTGWGIELNGVSGSTPTAYNRGRGITEYGNTAGPIYFNSSSGLVLNNEFEFTFFGLGSGNSGNPSYNPTCCHNLVHGSNLGTGCASTKIKHQLHHILSAGGMNSSDFDHIAFRARDDSGDGNIRAGSIIVTYGVPVSAGAASPINPTDAITIPNNRGLSAQKYQSTSNYQLIAGGTDNAVHIGSDGVATAIYLSAPNTYIASATTSIGFFGATPVSLPAAIPNTSGDTLSQLEGEANKIKNALRSLGLIHS